MFDSESCVRAKTCMSSFISTVCSVSAFLDFDLSLVSLVDSLTCLDVAKNIGLKGLLCDQDSMDTMTKQQGSRMYLRMYCKVTEECTAEL